MITMEQIQELLINWVPRLLFFLIVLYVGFFLIKRFINLLEKRLIVKKVDLTALGFFMSILNYFLKGIVIVISLSILNVPMASLTAVIGASTLSIGLALQGSLANLAGGLVLVTTQPFKVGDYIESDGFGGTVEEISVLTTRLNTVDGKRVVIPNSNVSSKGLINYSPNALRRIDLPVLLTYEASIEKAKSVFQGLIEEIEGAERSEILLTKLADSGYEFTLRFWIPTPEYFKQLFILNEKISPALEEAGLELAYPHLQLVTPGDDDEKIQQ